MLNVHKYLKSTFLISELEFNGMFSHEKYLKLTMILILKQLHHSISDH